ncbi:MAG TPA: 16S rRNA (adenine(1518)-N(6)/adenine(1519)-N(6))-dimethyltransferase RsmA [Vicinamibacterales bacterium]|nr:16S rRNA (adenine(1518)-N(6)/adenine(1519)-N(6))-dimethyltransferase RsmA [Vicinamibacterales bacterium]
MRREKPGSQPFAGSPNWRRKRLPSPFYAPRKRFGQNFLEPAWVDKLIRQISPRDDDTFLEIGPGRGALTHPLAERAGRVLAFEIDHDLAAALTASAAAHLTVVDGDFLDVTADRLRPLLSADERLRPLRVAGNLPYNIASPILFKLAELFADGLPLADAHVMLQREVADRLIAQPATSEYGVLTVLIGHIAEVAKVLSLPPGAFRPAPKVNSAVVRLRFHPPDPPVQRGQVFTDLVRAVFTHRRKTLANALLAFKERGRESLPGREFFPAALGRAGIDGARRPETLTIAEFARMADAVADVPLSGPA